MNIMVKTERNASRQRNYWQVCIQYLALMLADRETTNRDVSNTWHSC